jgi:trimethylamine--corrinoid protein Co-methyltransferase
MSVDVTLRPRLELLGSEGVERVVGEALQLLVEPGVTVASPEAAGLLEAAGASVAGTTVRIPERVVRDALASAPRTFDLFDRDGQPRVRYGSGAVHFDPGSCGVKVLDPETLERRPSTADDLVRIVKVAEMLPPYAAQSTAVICGDVPAEIGDLYRLFLVLLHSSKPVVTGSFQASGTSTMIELLAIDAGGPAALASRPRAVFDVCPSPPLTWTEFGASNLIELARAGVPAEIVSMPLAGGAAPVTLAGSIVQHASECLSGIAIHQLAAPGAPIVWGGAPAILDMRTGSTPMGAVETAMLNAGCAQIGRSLGLPTHGYLGGSDAKVVDAQAGLETGVAAVIGVLAGIDLISGAGMVETLLCQSAEKLVIDADALGMVQRLGRGIDVAMASFAIDTFAQLTDGDFLGLDETRKLFRREQFLPSPVIDRLSDEAWRQAGGRDTFARARERVAQLVVDYQPPAIDPAVRTELVDRVRALATEAGLPALPGT